MTIINIAKDTYQRLTSREFLAMLGYLFIFLPIVATRLPTNMQEIATMVGGIVTSTIMILRTFDKVKTREIENYIKEARDFLDKVQTILKDIKTITDEDRKNTKNTF